tara:strand:- start:1187 stop:1399 length:213 start_codon:yes stop_codon:yes gene_type:complete
MATKYVSFSDVGNKKQTNFFTSWFKSNNTTKPVTAYTIKENSKSVEEKFYEKYGIIYSGSIEGSCVNSFL